MEGPSAAQGLSHPAAGPGVGEDEFRNRERAVRSEMVERSLRFALARSVDRTFPFAVESAVERIFRFASERSVADEFLSAVEGPVERTFRFALEQVVK